MISWVLEKTKTIVTNLHDKKDTTYASNKVEFSANKV